MLLSWLSEARTEYGNKAALPERLVLFSTLETRPANDGVDIRPVNLSFASACRKKGGSSGFLVGSRPI